MRIICPSHARSKMIGDGAGVAKLLPNVVEYLVAEEEVDDYKAVTQRPVHGHKFGVGCMAPTLNWMFDNLADQDGECIIRINDDVEYISLRMDSTNPKKVDLEEEMICEVFHHLYICAADLGTNLFAVSDYPTVKGYNSWNPFSLSGSVRGGLIGLIDDGQRFDPKAFTFAECDYAVQSLVSHRRVWIDQRFHRKCTNYENPGGYANVRTEENEQAAADYMLKKWGSEIIKLGEFSKSGARLKVKIPWA